MRLALKTAAVAVCLLIVQWASGQTNQAGTNPSSRIIALPSEITLNDGRTYKSIALKRVEADGLFVTHIPDQGGVGMAKLKFSNLPEPIQKQFNYSLEKAAVHEQRQRESEFQWARWQDTQEEKASQIRQQRQIEDAKLRQHNEAMDVQRAQAEANKREVAAQRAQAERARVAQVEADRIRSYNPPQVNVINQNINRFY